MDDWKSKHGGADPDDMDADVPLYAILTTREPSRCTVLNSNSNDRY